MSSVDNAPLHDTTRERYLSYALSVITSRALPDVRDGLKPVQRRILYTMFHELALHPSNRYRKCAAVVGDVMGKYHPHGDTSIYDALVRLAQDFSLRDTLVDPQGNFGSLDGDPPAAMRYTECRLRPLAEELLQEITRGTVDFRPTYDGQRDEPIVLPAQFPQLLVNGSEGIAVGLSTRIPPHHLGEIVDACVLMITAEGEITVDRLLDVVKGPDFPTGGMMLNDRASLREIYETGSGSIRLRGEWTTEAEGRKHRVVITSVPYGVNKAKLVERIGEDVVQKKLPLVTDVRDESTDDVRVVLDLKAGADPEDVMAWLYKRTPLETSFPVNMNALVPVPDRPGLAVPERLDLVAALQHWLDFRYETVRRRYVYDLTRLEERIHILEGFAILFGGLDEAIRIIRESDGRRDAQKKLMARFDLSELQSDAILDLRLYRLARLEIQSILDELDEKRAAAAEIRRILGSEALLWERVRVELLELRKLYETPRRTTVGEPVRDYTFDESAYLVREDAWVVVTRDGWLKRQGTVTAVDKVRVREGDEVGWMLRTDTARTITFLGSDGTAYSMRVDDVPATTGFGKPLQTFFSMPDGARVVGVAIHDPAFLRGLPPAPPELPAAPDDPPPPHLVAITRLGRIVRLPLEPHAEPSNKNGRLFARLGEGDEVVSAEVSGGGEIVAVATAEGHALAFPVAEANVLKAAGKGTIGIKIRKGDHVLAFELATSPTDGPVVTTTRGRTFVVCAKEHAGPRAGRGRLVINRGGIASWQRVPHVRPALDSMTDGGPDADGGEE